MPETVRTRLKCGITAARGSCPAAGMGRLDRTAITTITQMVGQAPVWRCIGKVPASVPGMDGLVVIEALRKGQIRMPVLVLNALDTVEQRVRGLNTGADDYLAKPFAAAATFRQDRSAASACANQRDHFAGRTARA
jgi:DNA-binding NarL/FixJ family response regulator